MSAELRYIDAHSHVWTTDVARFPPQAGVAAGDVAQGWTVEDWSGETLLAAAAPSGVGRAVLIGHGNIYGYDNSYMLACCLRHPSRFRVVGKFNPIASKPPVACHFWVYFERLLGITAQIDDRRASPDLAATMRSLLRQGVSPCPRSGTDL